MMRHLQETLTGFTSDAVLRADHGSLADHAEARRSSPLVFNPAYGEGTVFAPSLTARRIVVPFGWVVDGFIASGATSDVWRVHRLDDKQRRPYAAKISRHMYAGDAPRPHWAPSTPRIDGAATDADARHRVLREIIVLRYLSHVRCAGVPEVVTFDLGSLPEQPACIILRFHAGGPMRAQGVRADTLIRVLGIVQGLAATLAMMHETPRRIVHGNVQMGNVLLDPEDTPLLVGFGSASFAGEPEGAAARLARSVPWRSPEMANFGVPVPASDVYMLGGLVHDALTTGEHLESPGVPAPRTSPSWSATRARERIERALRSWHSHADASAVAALVNRMLSEDPTRRPTARQVMRACRALRARLTSANEVAGISSSG
jgi:serine/threonine protein kinase